jgi:hypothetical protein
MFLGDSTALQLVDSFLKGLSQSVPNVLQFEKGYTSGYYISHYNLTVHAVQAPMDKFKAVLGNKHNTFRTAPDTVLLMFGAHWNWDGSTYGSHEMELDLPVFSANLEEWLSSGERDAVVFEPPPQHFDYWESVTKNNWKRISEEKKEASKRCGPFRGEPNAFRQKYFRQMFANGKAGFLPTLDILGPQWASHPGSRPPPDKAKLNADISEMAAAGTISEVQVEELIAGHDKNHTADDFRGLTDCTHWCWHSRLWHPLWERVAIYFLMRH